MLRITLLVMVALCGLEARSSAQVHVGFQSGNRAFAHAQVGPLSVRVGSPFRDRYRGVVPTRGIRAATCLPSPRARYEWVRKRVWVPGYHERVRFPAVYEDRYDDCGRRVRVLVREAHYERVWREGYWTYERHRVRRRF